MVNVAIFRVPVNSSESLEYRETRSKNPVGEKECIEKVDAEETQVSQAVKELLQ